MNRKEIIDLAKKYIVLADILDKNGLFSEAKKIDNEICLAINCGILPIRLNNIERKENIRVAIRGQSDWNDYLENMATWGGGAAGTAIGSGLGIPAAGIAAGIGAGLGAVTTFGGDLMFNKIQGETSKMEALGNDLMSIINNLTKTISQFNPNIAQQIYQLASALQENIMAVREQKRIEISQQVGLDPSKGFLQSINPLNWNKVLGRKWKMLHASNTKNIKVAADVNNAVIDPHIAAGLAQDITQGSRIGVKRMLLSPLTGGVQTGALGIAGGMVGGMAGTALGKYGYKAIINKIMGQMGVLQKQISDIQKIGMALAQISRDQSVILITRKIALLSQMALQELQQKIKQNYNQNQTFR